MTETETETLTEWTNLSASARRDYAAVLRERDGAVGARAAPVLEAVAPKPAASEVHPAVAQVLRHINEPLFVAAASHVARRRAGPEAVVAIRKLLEAQDAYQRADRAADQG